MVKEDWDHLAPDYDTREHRAAKAVLQSRQTKEKERIKLFIEQEPVLDYVKVPIKYLNVQLNVKFKPKNNTVYGIETHFLRVEKLNRRFYCCKHRVDLFKELVMML